MLIIRYTKRNISIALVLVFLIAVIVHLTIIQPFYDYDSELISSGWFRSLQYQSKSKECQESIDSHGINLESVGDERTLELEEIHEIIKKAKGYFVRDWSLWLGWNNVRYIIEAAVLQAQLLNRTLVLPSYVYARGCEFPIESCAAYFEMVNKNSILTNGDWSWRNSPIKGQMGWQIPISDMLDLPLLRSHHPTILVSEFLRIHGLDERLEIPKGTWDREYYMRGRYLFEFESGNRTKDGKPSLYVIHNDWYSGNIARVDYLSEDMKTRGEWDPNLVIDSDWSRIGGYRNVEEKYSVINEKLSNAMGGERKLDWGPAKDVLREIQEIDSDGVDLNANLDDDEDVKTVLRNNGWEVLYTYSSHVMNMMKSVTEPVYQVAPRSRIRGFIDDFGAITEDVLLLEGETHIGTKPGQMEFSTGAGQDLFTTTVLHYIVPPPRVYRLADELAKRMEDIVGERRMWMAAHMRRGDYVDAGWVMEHSIENHLDRIKERFKNGMTTLVELHNKSFALEPSDIPDVVPDMRVLTLEPPEEDTPYFIATDERDPAALTYLKSNNAILITDLLTPSLRRQFGYRLLISDILALVEQTLMSRADYFYGHLMSSVVGGVINMRGREGKDRRCSLAD